MLREFASTLSQRTDVLRVRIEAYVFQRDEPEPGLAMSRAQAIMDYMVNNLGMRRDLFETVDGGDGYFYAGAVDMAMFRRVEFSVLVRRAR